MGELILGIILIYVFKTIFSRGSSGSSFQTNKQLSIQTEIKTLESGLTAMLVNLYGVLENPSTRNPTCLLRIIDVTEAHEKKPVFCNAPNWSNDEGQFASTMNFEAPYRQTDFSGYTIGLLPLSILDFPKKGRRKIRIIAVIFDGLIPLGTVEKDAYYNNPNKGYLDIIEAIRTSEVTIAKLSVAVSAIDGSIDQIEEDAIDQYFKNRFDQVSESTDRKSKVLSALREYSSTFKNNRKSTTTIQNEITNFCNQIVSHENESISESAFQLAVEVVSADNKIEAEEKKIIELIKFQLQIDEATATEIEDRYIKIDQYIDADDEEKLGMPANLNDSEKKTWLTREYGKWKNRVTHSDPVKSKEASDRLELITRCRDRISV